MSACSTECYYSGNCPSNSSQIKGRPTPEMKIIEGVLVSDNADEIFEHIRTEEEIQRWQHKQKYLPRKKKK